MRNSLIATACILGAQLSAAQEPAFDSTSRAYHTGAQVTTEAYRPEGQVLADLDGDGDLDVALAHNGNFIDPHMSVQMNLGNGSLGPPVVYDTIGETMDVVAEDFDGDGDIDLAFAQSDNGIGGQFVLVFLNNGDGSFQPERRFFTGLGPTGICALDVDGDGDMDLATANWRWSEEDVSVLTNDGNADFSQRTDFKIAGQQPYKIVAGDLHGDGRTDLIVSLSGGVAICVLENTGGGGFSAPILRASLATSQNSIPGLGIGDVDGDGDLDVLFPTNLFRNMGGNLVAQPYGPANVFTGMNDFAVADVTLDGFPDVVGVQHSSPAGWHLLPGDGQGGFGASTSYRTGELARAISVGDMDADGEVDVVVANPGSLTITVHTNDAGVFRMPPSYPTSSLAKELDTADIDLDGDLDIVTTTSVVYSMFNDGSGDFAVSSFSPALGALSVPKLRDLNGDGYPDLMVLRGSTLNYALNTKTGAFASFTALAAGTCNAKDYETLDANGDGWLDIAMSSSCSNVKVGLLISDGAGGWTSSTLSDVTLLGSDQLTCGDFDSDGFEDVLTGHNNGVVVWRGKGDGTFHTPIWSSTVLSGIQHLAVADFDGDGNLDATTLSAGSTFQGELMGVHLGFGDGSFGPPQILYGLFSLQYTGVAGIDVLDADGDGAIDIVAGAYGAGDVALFRNQGNGTFAPEERYGVNGRTLGVRAGDFDGDGREDVCANTSANFNGGTTILFGRASSEPVAIYCTAKVNSLGCTPAIGASGSSSAQASSGFVVEASMVRNNKAGLLFYGTSGRQALAFQNGTLCVALPLRRTPVVFSGGSPQPANDCSGVFALDMNAFAAGLLGGNPDPNLLIPGATVDCQWWGRDPGFPAPAGTTLSDALEYTVQP